MAPLSPDPTVSTSINRILDHFPNKPFTSVLFIKGTSYNRDVYLWEDIFVNKSSVVILKKKHIFAKLFLTCPNPVGHWTATGHKYEVTVFTAF
jgi:hypothetical protein